MIDLTNIDNGNDLEFLCDLIVKLFNGHIGDRSINMEFEFSEQCLKNIYSEENPNTPDDDFDWNSNYPTYWTTITLAFMYVANGQMFDGKINIVNHIDKTDYEINVEPFGFKLTLFPMTKFKSDDVDYVINTDLSSKITHYLVESFYVDKIKFQEMFHKLKYS